MNTYALPEKKNFRILTSTAYYAPLAFTLLFFVMLLALSDLAKASVTASLKVCASVLIPSLFPFMVAGEIFFSLGASGSLSKLIGKPFERCFGISGQGAGAFLLGAVCGLPLGGKYALTLYENGNISKQDCEALMGISTNAGMGFVVAGIGGGIWGSYAFGWLIYACQIFASVVSGILLCRGKKSSSVAPAIGNLSKKPFFAALTDAVSSSVIGMLKICAFVVFFGVVNSYVSFLCNAAGLPRLLAVTLSSFTEISDACSALYVFYKTGTPAALHSAKILTFFAVGFAGLSAHMQLSSFASEAGVSMRKYYLTKLLCGLICSLTGAVVLHFFTF